MKEKKNVIVLVSGSQVQFQFFHCTRCIFIFIFQVLSFDHLNMGQTIFYLNLSLI